MKKEWKPEELRQTSEEIRGATLAKSITPEMVGGTLSGLTEALAEVVDVLGEIPREHVTVKVRGCNTDGLVSTAGATVDVEIFSTRGYPLCRPVKATLETDENCEVAFDVPHGFTFSLVAKCAGMGASFQLVYDATRAERLITLWCFPVGVFWYGQTSINADDKENWQWYPFIRSAYSNTITETDISWIEDDCADKDVSGLDWAGWRGILISTGDTAFVIMERNLSDGYVRYRAPAVPDYEVPFCSSYDPDETEGSVKEDRYRKAAALSITDFDGNANTAKQLRYCVSPTAAIAAASMNIGYWLDAQTFLPSAGQIYLMWQNRTAVNALMTSANADGMEFKLLPYKDENGKWVLPNGNMEYLPSSTQAGQNFLWTVAGTGDIDIVDWSLEDKIRAVTVFTFFG